MIYISDLDNTLLTDNRVLTDYSRDELNRLIDNGLNFTIASARSIISIQKLLSGLNLKLPIIEFNGAFLTDFNTGKHIQTNNIEPAILKDLIQLIRETNNEPFLSTFDGKNDKLYYETLYNDGMKWYQSDRVNNKDKRLESTSDLNACTMEDVVCFTIINREDNLLNLRKRIQMAFGNYLEILLMENYYSKGWFWLTLHNNKATKANGVMQLIEMSGFHLSEWVVFGDNQNDISMFNLAPRSIAVENATSPLKKIASEIIGSNNEDSVVKYIKHDFIR